MWRTCLLGTLLLVAPGTTADPPAPPPPRVRTAADFPPGLRDLAGPLGALDSLSRAALRPPEGDINKRFNKAGPQNLYRWGWLTAKRRNIEYYDGLARQAAVHDREFRRMLAATDHPRKASYLGGVHEFDVFLYQRIIQREGWYYTAKGHHWRWEEDRPGGPVNARIERRICKWLGCTTMKFETYLAWVDLFATELLPRHMSLFLTVPFAVMS